MNAHVNTVNPARIAPQSTRSNHKQQSSYLLKLLLETERALTVDPDAASIFLSHAISLLTEKKQSELSDREAKGGPGQLAGPVIADGRFTGLVSMRFTRQGSLRPGQIERGRALAHQTRFVSEQSCRAAIMEERNRLARDIHDTLAQGYTGIIIQLEAAADARMKALDDEADVHIGRAIELARDSLNDARRSLRALRPQVLTGRNLCDAVQELISRRTRDTPLQADFKLQGQPVPLPPEWNSNILFICQEVLTNALRHANATAFRAELAFGSQYLRIRLRDNGDGFDTTAEYEGFGLLGIRERVEGMSGVLVLDSERGSHTELNICLTLNKAGSPSPETR